MKVTIETTTDALERICEAQAILRAYVPALFGWSAVDLNGPAVNTIVGIALDLGLDVTLNEAARVIVIDA